MTSSARRLFWVPLAALLGLSPFVSSISAAKWRPIDPADLAATTPRIDPNADAEALLWDVRVSDEFVADTWRTVYDHYLRIKIFTERGRDEQSRVELPYSGRVRVQDVSARSVRPNGVATELKGSEIFNRDIVKGRGVKMKAVSFAIPGVEPGSIIEYQWREYHDDTFSHLTRLEMSRDIPVRLVKYHIRPLPVGGEGYGMRAQAFNGDPTPVEREGPDLVGTSLSGVPADREEPYAPSSWATRPWVLLYYRARSSSTDAMKFWEDYGRDLAKEFRKDVAVSDAVRQAASAAAAAATVDDKIAAVLDICRSRVARVDVDTATDAERKAYKPNRSPQQTLEQGRGTAGDVVALFTALAGAAGLDARIALAADRDDVPFDARQMLPGLLTNLVVAVRAGDRWLFVAPQNRYEVSGRPHWSVEHEPVLVPDEQTPLILSVPPQGPEWTTKLRTAKARLSEDGALEGDMTLTYGGHLDVANKEDDDDLSPEEREKALTDLVRDRIPGAEVTLAKVENVTEVGKPYTNRYHLRVPDYAARTGTRLFLPPAVFQRGVKPLFTAAERRYPVEFPYSWSERDQVSIYLPPGFEIEEPDVPSDVRFADVGFYHVQILRAADSSRIEYVRQLSFGSRRPLLFSPVEYQQIKTFFDEVQKRDAHTLTLRRRADAPAAAGPVR